MRWVYVTAVRLGRTGGQSTRILEFCRALAKVAEVVLLAPPADFPLPEGVRYIPLPLPARPPREIIFQLNAYRTLRQLSGPPPDAIYVYAGAFNTGALVFARQAHSRSLLELNGLPYLEFGLEHPGAQGVWLRAIMYRLMASVDTRLTDLIVTVTRQLARAIRQHTRARTPILVSSNGVNPTQFQPRPTAEARAALGLPAVRNRLGGVSPLKVFEYLGCGKPVLGAAVPGMELIQQEGVGALFTPGDPGDLAAQLDRLLSLPAAEREAIGRRARQVAVEKYAWEIIVRRIVEVIRPSTVAQVGLYLPEEGQAPGR